MDDEMPVVTVPDLPITQEAPPGFSTLAEIVMTICDVYFKDRATAQTSSAFTVSFSKNLILDVCVKDPKSFVSISRTSGNTTLGDIFKKPWAIVVILNDGKKFKIAVLDVRTKAEGLAQFKALFYGLAKDLLINLSETHLLNE